MEKNLKNEGLWIYPHLVADQEGWGSFPIYFRILFPFLAVFILNPCSCSSYTLKTSLRASSCVCVDSDDLPPILIRSAPLASRLNHSASTPLRSVPDRSTSLRLDSFGSRLTPPGYSFGTTLLAGSSRASSLVLLP